MIAPMTDRTRHAAHSGNHREVWHGGDRRVPAEVGVSGRIGTGAIDLSGVSVVDVATSDGRITVANASGDLTAMATVQEVDAQTATGAITLVVPATGQAYRVQARAATGSTRVNVPTNPAGGPLLNLSTQDGNITVDPA
jgi:DUF4097 and DUF4098 domain-containing protein YvlB